MKSEVEDTDLDRSHRYVDIDGDLSAGVAERDDIDVQKSRSK
jgi:hypothetical protein